MRFSISSALTQPLIEKDHDFPVSSIYILNTHASDDVSVNLYMQRAGGNSIYILKNTSIPKGVALQIPLLSFDGSLNKDGLFVKLSAADSTVDIILT